MSRSKNLVKNFFKDLSSEKKAVEFPGFLGNHAGTIKADDYGNVWVILFNGKQVKVRNNVAPLVPRTPVVVGYSKDDPKLLQVLRVWNVYDRNTEPYLPPHAKTHTWPGADTVNIREEQFLPGLALPAGDMTVQFYGWYYKIAGQWYLAPAQLIDLASYVPASGAIWVSVEIDAAGDITYVESDSQDNRYLLTLADIPETPKTRALLFAVKCYAGQTEVIKSEILNDIFNPRMAYSAAESVEWGDIGGTVTNQTDLVSYIDSRLVGLWDDRGNYDASGGAYPSSGGSGTAGAILKGDIWTISVAGTLPTGQAVEVGDTVRALVNAPGNTQANWAISQNNIGYVAENSANKTDTMAGNESSSTKYLSAKGVYDWAISTFQAALGYTAENSANKTSTITGNESSTTLYSTIKGIVDWVKQGLTGVLPSKTTPVDGDSVLINDSADSNKTKLTTWANIKATLKTYFDTLYAAITGWQAVSQTWTAASSDDPVYQIYVSGDVTANADYKLGNKIAVTISGADRYGFIVKVGAYDAGNTRTPVDIYGGTDYDITGTMTSPRISKVKSPDGFPMAKSKWTVSLTDTTIRSQASPVANTWYNPGSLSITIPIGVWDVNYQVAMGQDGLTARYCSTYGCLSTSSSSKSNAICEVYFYIGLDEIAVGQVSKNEQLSLTSKTTYYCVIMTEVGSGATLYMMNNRAKMVTTAVCAYL